MKSLSVLAAVVLAASANASTISFSDSFGLAAVNWNHNLTLEQFDSSLGTLNQVTINYSGTTASNFQFESLDATSATLSFNNNGQFLFGGLISDTLNTSGSTTVNVSEFDGSIDFVGTSGGSVGPIIDSVSETLTTLTGLAAYIGTGTFSINVIANGLSSVNGAGNLITRTNTQALANIQVVYEYTAFPNQVPEPGSLALVGLALACIGFSSLRRKA